MVKHYNIKIEGDLDNADFNYYCQTGAYKFDISAVYVNGNSRDVELSAEGDEENLKNYLTYLHSGPLTSAIETFNFTESEVEGMVGFISKRHFRAQKKSILNKIFRKKEKK